MPKTPPTPEPGADVTRRLGATEVARRLLERRSTSHSSVNIARSARGVVTLEVSIAVGDGDDVATIDQAVAKAEAIFDGLDERHPFVDPASSGASS